MSLISPELIYATPLSSCTNYF